MRREDQRHRVVGDLLDKGVGAVGDRNAALGGGGDIDAVDPDAAERDDLAALQPVDHAFGYRPAFGIERVGLPRGSDEILFGTGGDLEDFGVDRCERLHLVAVAAAGDSVAGAGGRRDPELGQSGPPF